MDKCDEVPSGSDSPPSLFDTLLAPGSSLHPTFLFAVDCAFTFLLLVLASLAVVTHGNVHLFALIAIAGALWASVKWFVSELQKVKAQPQATGIYPGARHTGGRAKDE